MKFQLNCQYGGLDNVEDILTTKRHCIDINYYDAQGVTCLQWAALGGYKDIVLALLDAKADPTLKDKVEGKTALDYAKEQADEKGLTHSIIAPAKITGEVTTDGHA